MNQNPLIFSRRQAVQLLGASGATLLSGCCELRSFPTPVISQPPLAHTGVPLKPIIVKSTVAPKLCIDVHAHFFNASDVTVKGFLEGPVAYSKGGVIGALISALAPFADELGLIAPSATNEYQALLSMATRSDLNSLVDHAPLLRQLVDQHHVAVSGQFYDLVKGSAFEKQYNALQDERAQSLRGLDILGVNTNHLDANSVAAALKSGSRPNLLRTTTQRQFDSSHAYPDGTLAFVGCMLSYRWMNLFEYSQAYSAAPGAFGIDQTLGALVDFDHWLDCPPRSAHEDQVKVFELMSRLSGGYMRPLIAYNPWSASKNPEEAVKRVVDAVTLHGFVGVKLYPPNGFRPYGNEHFPIAMRGAPSPAALDTAMKALWYACEDLQIPVMAHTGESMGKNAAFNDGADPKGWGALLALSQGHPPPFVNLGHFGGDESSNDWTLQFAGQMQDPEGVKVFGDLAYWSNLRSRYVNEPVYTAAHTRLATALQRSYVAKRVMYGSDWHMLAQEPDWAAYPFDIAAATHDLPINAADLFGNNAVSCFGARLNEPAPA
jgi:predicted TIM-barrel fold metal-dependent hydrolase